MKKTMIYLFLAVLFMAGGCGKDDNNGEELSNTPLHQQTGFGKKYTTITITPLYSTDQASPAFQDLFMEARENLYAKYGGRQLESFEIVFSSATQLIVRIYYRADTGIATATYTYTFRLSDSGLLSLLDLEATNTNGTNLKPYITGFLEGYLQAYTFRLDWIEDKIPGSRGTLAAFYRSDDPSSYFYGTIK